MAKVVSFGEWMEMRRKRLGLTRKELAGLAGCAAVTVQKIERDERRPSVQLAQLLAKHLEIHEAEQGDFILRARGEYRPRLGMREPKAQSLHIPTSHNLPIQATPFLGREDELAALSHLITQTHVQLVSVVGAGGIGKTRLALEVAHGLHGLFPDGTAFIPLASLPSEASIVPTMAQALHFTFQGGQDEKTQLINFLSEKKLLLVIDNFEHLLDNAFVLVEIIANAPHIKMIVTSREKLKLQIEQIYPLQPLPLLTWENVSQAKQDPVVQLFWEYGRRFRPSWELQFDELDTLREILKLVDGMPLAIILASAWMELLNLAEIAAEIQKNIGFLKADYQDLPARQRSMNAVFDASWDQLNDQEQTLFAALSVFCGGFTMEAVLAVTGTSLPVLLGLVNRSLLTRSENGRFEIHELLRQFGAAKLALSPTQEIAIRDAHSAYYLKFLEATEPELKGAHAEETLELIQDEINNIYEGWYRAIKEEHLYQLGIAAFSLSYFSNRTGRYKEALAAFEQAISRIQQQLANEAASDRTTMSIQIRLLAHKSELHHNQGDMTQAFACANEVLASVKATQFVGFEIRYEKALSLYALGWSHAWHDRYAEAKELLKKSLSLFEELGDEWYSADIHLRLGGNAIRSANYEEAVWQYRKAAEIFTELGHRHSIAHAKAFIGYSLASIDGKQDEIKALMNDSIAVFQELKDDLYVALTLVMMAEVQGFYGSFLEAQMLAENGMTRHQRFGHQYWLMGSKDKWCWVALHLGNYEGVLEKVQTILDYAEANDAKMRLGRGHVFLGDIWLARHRLDKAVGHLERGATILRGIKANDYLCLALGSLSCAYIQSGDYINAEKIILEAMKFALHQKTPVYLSAIFSPLALLMAQSGYKERAIELYTLAHCQPFVANSRWYEDVYGPLFAEVAASLPPENFAAAQERGRHLNYWHTAQSLMTHLRESGRGNRM